MKYIQQTKKKTTRKSKHVRIDNDKTDFFLDFKEEEKFGYTN